MPCAACVREIIGRAAATERSAEIQLNDNRIRQFVRLNANHIGNVSTWLSLLQVIFYFLRTKKLTKN